MNHLLRVRRKHHKSARTVRVLHNTMLKILLLQLLIISSAHHLNLSNTTLKNFPFTTEGKTSFPEPNANTIKESFDTLKAEMIKANENLTHSGSNPNQLADLEASHLEISSDHISAKKHKVGTSISTVNLDQTLTKWSTLTDKTMERLLFTNTSSGSTVDSVNPNVPSLNISKYVISCKQRCGEDFSFPCSCNEKCVVHKTCCEDLHETCPELYTNALAKFRTLLLASIRCDPISMVFTVDSCPPISSENVNPLKRDAQFFQTVSSTIPLTQSSKPDNTEKMYSMSEILLNAPVTDYKTGIIYANVTIYECNKRNTYLNSTQTSANTAEAWKAQIGSSSQKNPVKLTTVRQDLDFSTYSYVPSNSQLMTAGSLCYNQIALTCITELSTKLAIQQLICNVSVSEYYEIRHDLLLTIQSDPNWAQNDICAICLALYQSSSDGGNRFFPSGFKVLTSLDKNPLYVVYDLHKGWRQLRKPIPWWSWTCKIPDKTTNGADRVCRVLQCDERFLLTPDGLCRKAMEAEFAIQEEVMFKGSYCKINPNAFAEITKCYLLAISKVTATNKTFRSYQIFMARRNITLIAIRMEMYIDAEQFENSIVALYQMHETFFPTMSLFLKHYCSINEEQALGNNVHPRSISEKLLSSQKTSHIKSLKQPKGESISSFNTNETKDTPVDFYYSYCFQISTIDSSLDDAIFCDWSSGWNMGNGTKVDTHAARAIEIECLNKPDVKYASNESNKICAHALPFLAYVMVNKYLFCIAAISCLLQV